MKFHDIHNEDVDKPSESRRLHQRDHRPAPNIHHNVWMMSVTSDIYAMTDEFLPHGTSGRKWRAINLGHGRKCKLHHGHCGMSADPVTAICMLTFAMAYAYCVHLASSPSHLPLKWSTFWWWLLRNSRYDSCFAWSDKTLWWSSEGSLHHLTCFSYVWSNI